MAPSTDGLPTLRPHDWPGDARPLFTGAPRDTPVVSSGAGGVDPDRVNPPFRTVPASSGHVVRDYDGLGAAEWILSPARMRSLADALGSAQLVVCVPMPGRLLVAPPHPVSVALLESLGGSIYDVVARNGGAVLSRRLYLVTDGAVVATFEPGTLAARRAVGVAARAPTQALPVPEPGATPRPAGLFGWIRRVTGA